MTINGKVVSNQFIPKSYCLNNSDLAFLPENIILIRFDVMYSRHIKSLVKEKYDKKIQKSLFQSLFSAMITFGLEIELFFRKAGLTIMSAISNIF